MYASRSIRAEETKHTPRRCEITTPIRQAGGGRDAELGVTAVVCSDEHKDVVG